jgi:hypothetical protein
MHSSSEVEASTGRNFIILFGPAPKFIVMCAPIHDINAASFYSILNVARSIYNVLCFVVNIFFLVLVTLERII